MMHFYLLEVFKFEYSTNDQLNKCFKLKIDV